MPVACIGLLARLDERRLGEDAHRLEHSVTPVDAGVVGDDEGLPHQREQLHEPGRPSAHGERGLDGEAARKGGEAPEHDPFVLGEEAVAPLDRRLQRAVAVGSATCGEQLEPVGESLDDLVRRELCDLRGGELDGQRDAVEPPADLGDVDAR